MAFISYTLGLSLRIDISKAAHRRAAWMMKPGQVYFLIIYFFSLLFCLFLPVNSFAEHKAAHTSFTLENDLFTPDKTDRYYTSGMRLSFISSTFDEFNDENSYGWMREFFGDMDLISADGYRRVVASGVGQIVITPDDITKTEDQPDDLPYAGLLYGFYSMNGQRAGRAETLSFMLGVIGPLSMAEESQKFLHKISGSHEPKGWRHQLKNELAINLSYDRRYLLTSYRPGNYWDIDLVGTGALYLGNVITGANLSMAVVLGREHSFNPLSIRPDIIGRDSIAVNGSTRTGPFLLAGAGTDYWLRSFYLDGNILGDGSSLDKKPLVYNRFFGFGYNWLSFSAHIGWVKHTQLFEGQKKGMEYGSINFSWSP
ncbi:MAG: lipid A deacylase LpxR family protein [bacterium]|nr:lipid A deacylase LpxR family protein [bacterium]